MPENKDDQGRYTRGICKFCGQVHIVPFSDTQEEADDRAAALCDCAGAVKERRRLERIERATGGVERVFGSGASDVGQKPVDAGTLRFLKAAVELMAGEAVDSVTVDIPGICQAKFRVTAKGNIKISRSETRVRSFES